MADDLIFDKSLSKKNDLVCNVSIKSYSDKIMRVYAPVRVSATTSSIKLITDSLQKKASAILEQMLFFNILLHLFNC